MVLSDTGYGLGRQLAIMLLSQTRSLWFILYELQDKQSVSCSIRFVPGNWIRLRITLSVITDGVSFSERSVPFPAELQGAVSLVPMTAGPDNFHDSFFMCAPNLVRGEMAQAGVSPSKKNPNEFVICSEYNL